jgi:hypothetical protein
MLEARRQSPREIAQVCPKHRGAPIHVECSPSRLTSPPKYCPNGCGVDNVGH